MKVYTLNEGIDLGDNILGVFSTREKADVALETVDRLFTAAVGRTGHGFRVEEHELDQIQCESWWFKAGSR